MPSFSMRPAAGSNLTIGAARRFEILIRAVQQSRCGVDAAVAMPDQRPMKLGVETVGDLAVAEIDELAGSAIVRLEDALGVKTGDTQVNPLIFPAVNRTIEADPSFLPISDLLRNHHKSSGSPPPGTTGYRSRNL